MKKGLIVYAVMLALAQDEIYVADIITMLDNVGFAVPEGTLYPLLNRLKTDGYVIYDRKESPQGPPRKYYTLSPSGHEQIQLMQEERASIVDSIKQLTPKK